jgi:hypothetical protein
MMGIHMKSMILAASLAGALAAQVAQANCTYPVAPGKFPDGTVASREEMQAAKKLVVQYDADMNAYLVCIRSVYETTAAAQTDAKQKADLARTHAQKEDAALAEVHDVVGRFNEQLKSWKAKNDAAKKTP